MDKLLWGKIESLLIKCEGMDADEAHNFLIEETRNDHSLIARVEHYLTYAEKSDNLFVDIIGNAVENTIQLSERGIPERIGAYKILKKIAQGGMGSVYLARRDDDTYEQDVVIKIVDGILSNQHKYRFQQERKILAKLQHPNIAQIVDAGSVNSQQYFLIMEYIDGKNIDSYCRENNLTLKNRIELFIDVCKAVQFAHRNLIVHRDIKPSNVIVDKRGTVKLLDFGIAKMLADDELEGDALTKTHMRLMTPDYASPEQVRGEEVTTASDIYSLGALLYQILVGTTPLVFKKNSPAEIEKTVCETIPLKVSTAFRQQQKNLTKKGKKSDRVFINDLDNILLKTLRKEIENRYDSVIHLIDDLHNLLNNRPVNATPISRSYLIKKYIKRNIWKSAFIAFAILSLTSLLFVQYYNNLQLTREKSEAQKQAEIAEQTSKYLTHLIETADPEYFQGREISVLEALDQGVKSLLDDQELDGNVKSHLLLVLSRVYRNRSEDKKGLELLEHAIIQREKFDKNNPSFFLAQIVNEYGDTLRQNFQLNNSIPQFNRAIRILRPLHSQEARAELANTYNNSGIAFTQLGQYHKAEQALEQAITLTTEDNGAKSSYLYNFARLFLFQKKLLKALKYYQQSYELKLKIYGPTQRRTLNTLQGLMLTQKALGNYGEALNHAEFILQQKIKLVGEKNHQVDVIKEFLMELYQQTQQKIKYIKLYSYLYAKSYTASGKISKGSFLPSLARVKEYEDDIPSAFNFWTEYKNFLLTNQPARTRSIDQAEFNRLRLLLDLKNTTNLSRQIKLLSNKLTLYYPASSLETFQAKYLLGRLWLLEKKFSKGEKILKQSLLDIDPTISSPLLSQIRTQLKTLQQKH